MKSFIIYISVLLCTYAVNYSVKAQKSTVKTETIEFQVSGVCGMCKERIENAALIKGVKLAEWNNETGMIKVIFNPQKTNKATIQKAIADAGHDTENVKADDKAYSEIPKCCKYRDGIEKH